MTPASQVELPSVQQAYDELENFVVEDNGAFADARTCAVYFSSNGLYFPNTEAAAHDALWIRNRYEWMSLAPAEVSRRIFVRDVYKQWYVKGINARNNDMSAVVQSLGRLTAGYRTRCVGNSAGAYAAAVVGSLIGADSIVCVSPHLDLSLVMKTPADEKLNPLLVDYLERGGEYADAVRVLREGGVKTIVLYAAHEQQDREHVKLVAGLDNVWPIAFDTDEHGTTCWNGTYPDLLRLDAQSLKALAARFETRVVSPLRFSRAVGGLSGTARVLARMQAGRLRALARRL